MCTPLNNRHCWWTPLMWFWHKCSQMRSCFKGLFAISIVSFRGDFPIPEEASDNLLDILTLNFLHIFKAEMFLYVFQSHIWLFLIFISHIKSASISLIWALLLHIIQMLFFFILTTILTTAPSESQLSTAMDQHVLSFYLWMSSVQHPNVTVNQQEVNNNIKMV